MIAKTPHPPHNQAHQKPRILLCTPEITELPEGMGNAAQYIQAKGGGLGDISASLIRYLWEDGRFQLHVALPKYDAKIRDFHRLGNREIDVLAPLLQRQGVHLISDSAFANLSEVYGDSPSHSRIRRAEALQRYIINQLLDEIRPDVVHCNDWMTGLIPAAAREKGIKSLFTLHNVFTERETPLNVNRSGINVQRFAQWLYFEQFPEAARPAWNWTRNRIDFTASGIFAADMVNTVSETFLKELVRGDFDDITPPSILHTVRMKHETGNALGVLNAPNDTIDPRQSRYITPYFVEDVIEKKRVNKQVFQERMGLQADAEAPLFLWPSRLYPQKGPELLAAIAARCVRRWGIQIALVANGDTEIEKTFRTMASRSHGHIAYQRFQSELSELGKAAADFVLMPSRYEPCGLPQMECPRFGTLPVARSTGGLRDTVFELDVHNNTGNGFVFEAYEASALEAAMERAVAFCRLPIDTRRLHIQRIMRDSFENFTLAKTAQAYIRLYEKLIASASA